MSNLAHKMTDKDVYDHLQLLGQNEGWPVAVWEVFILVGLLALAGLSLLGII
jgi:hypothetical protein